MQVRAFGDRGGEAADALGVGAVQTVGGHRQAALEVRHQPGASGVVERGGVRLVARGADPEKDQSYMLATVDPELLERVAFPLGGQAKTDTRAEAAAAGLAALAAIGAVGKTLVVLGDGDENAWKSFRNAVGVHTVHVGELNTYDVLNNDVVVFTAATLPTGAEASKADDEDAVAAPAASDEEE